MHNVYSDNFTAIRKSVKLLGARWEPSQPGVHQTNAIIERCNGDILAGSRANMCQAGLPACFWPYACPHYCHVENITCDEDDSSPWLLRRGSHFPGKALPLGCGVFFLPAPTKYTNSKSATKMSYGVLLGYRLAPGGRWKGEYVVADLSDFIGKSLNS